MILVLSSMEMCLWRLAGTATARGKAARGGAPPAGSLLPPGVPAISCGFDSLNMLTVKLLVICSPLVLTHLPYIYTL